MRSNEALGLLRAGWLYHSVLEDRGSVLPGPKVPIGRTLKEKPNRHVRVLDCLERHAQIRANEAK